MWAVSNTLSHAISSALLNPDCVESELTGSSVNIPSPLQHVCVSLQTHNHLRNETQKPDIKNLKKVFMNSLKHHTLLDMSN